MKRTNKYMVASSTAAALLSAASASHDIDPKSKYAVAYSGRSRYACSRWPESRNDLVPSSISYQRQEDVVDVVNIPTLGKCKDLCTRRTECKGIEYNSNLEYCSLWLIDIQSMIPIDSQDDELFCYRKFESLPQCQYTRTWDAGYGNCQSYAPISDADVSNHKYCSIDESDGTSANDACAECGQCVNKCIYGPNASDNGIDCSTYHPLHESGNHHSCSTDMYRGVRATEACMECGQCISKEEDDAEPTSRTALIKADGVNLCWKVRGGRMVSRNKVVLDNCDFTDKDQQFTIHNYSENAVYIQPRGAQRLHVVGRLSSEHHQGRLALGTKEQIFSIEDTGRKVFRVGLGDECHGECLFATNQDGYTKLHSDSPSVVLRTMEKMYWVPRLPGIQVVEAWSFLYV